MADANTDCTCDMFENNGLAVIVLGAIALFSELLGLKGVEANGLLHILVILLRRVQASRDAVDTTENDPAAAGALSPDPTTASKKETDA